MFLHRFGIKNYKLHSSTEIELFPITVLVGPNSGGKSAFFEALVNFSQVSRGNIQRAFGPWPHSFAARINHAAPRTARIGFRATMGETVDSSERLSYTIDYAQSRTEGSEPTYTIFDEKLTRIDTSEVLFDRSNPGSYPFKTVEDRLSHDRSIFATIRRARLETDFEDEDSLVTHCAAEVSRVGLFRLDPTNLARPGRLPDSTLEPLDARHAPRLDYRGQDLAGVLYYLDETDDPRLERIVEHVAQVIDGFQGFDFNVVGSDRVGLSARFSDSRGLVAAANLSHGALALMGLMTLVLTPERPAVICIEEPENGLTPRAARAFYAALRDLAFAEDPSERSQVLISSHSPFVICDAWNGEDRDFIYQVKADGGSATIRGFADVITEHGIQLRKKGGKRTELGLTTADQVMSGIYT